MGCTLVHNLGCALSFNFECIFARQRTVEGYPILLQRNDLWNDPSATSAKATVNDPTSDDEGEFGENQDAYMNLYPSTSEDKTLYRNNNLLSVLPLSPSAY
ncbi:hypothetical protein N7541_011374 [Penicillium brevicompactum]|uniref:Uncharacterized protein n=1 Tax=Penicillium brevicompactum TaxID=5074 RepID=A0A9W9QRT8_PENBR|nr:hypothetical protein N7541_011374 [Penicillium brevicompactum]